MGVSNNFSKDPAPRLLYKVFFMLNSTEHEIYSAHAYSNSSCSNQQSMKFILLINSSSCWHFNKYKQDKFHAQLS